MVYCDVCSTELSSYGILLFCCFFFQAEDGIRDIVRSRGLGDVYKRQGACSRTDDASISGESSARGEDAAAEDGSWTILQLSLIHI